MVVLKGGNFIRNSRFFRKILHGFQADKLVIFLTRLLINVEPSGLLFWIDLCKKMVERKDEREEKP